MLVQLNKCDVCGSDLQRGHSGDGCLTSSTLFKYERGWDISLFRVGSGYDGLHGGVLFRGYVL